MIPAAFDYVRADSADHAISLLQQHGDDAKLLAGGHSLIPLMKYRLASPAVLVDIGRLSDLSYVKEDGANLRIGALTRHRDLEVNPLLKQHAPLLANAASHVGDPQVRHRGTIGGSLSHGDPASDLPAIATAGRSDAGSPCDSDPLGATLVIKGAKGTREVSSDDFFKGFLETALEPDELLTEIKVPKMNGAKWSFQKFNRRAMDWAIVGCAVVVNGNKAGVGLVNMDSRPIRRD